MVITVARGKASPTTALSLRHADSIALSAGTVSQVAKTLDAAVAAFHRRPLKDIYPRHSPVFG